MKVIAIDTPRKHRPVRGQKAKKPNGASELVFTESEAVAELRRPRFGDPVLIAILRKLVELEDEGDWEWPEAEYPEFRELSEMAPEGADA